MEIKGRLRVSVSSASLRLIIERNNLTLRFTGIKPQSRREHRGRTNGELPFNKQFSHSGNQQRCSKNCPPLRRTSQLGMTRDLGPTGHRAQAVGPRGHAPPCGRPHERKPEAEMRASECQARLARGPQGSASLKTALKSEDLPKSLCALCDSVVGSLVVRL